MELYAYDWRLENEHLEKKSLYFKNFDTYKIYELKFQIVYKGKKEFLKLMWNTYHKKILLCKQNDSNLMLSSKCDKIISTTNCLGQYGSHNYDFSIINSSIETSYLN